MLLELLRANNAERTWSVATFTRGSESQYTEGKAFLVDSHKRAFIYNVRFSSDRHIGLTALSTVSKEENTFIIVFLYVDNKYMD